MQVKSTDLLGVLQSWRARIRPVLVACPSIELRTSWTPEVGNNSRTYEEHSILITNIMRSIRLTELEIQVALLRCEDCKKIKMEIIFNRTYLNKSYFSKANLFLYSIAGSLYAVHWSENSCLCEGGKCLTSPVLIIKRQSVSRIHQHSSYN